MIHLTDHVGDNFNIPYDQIQLRCNTFESVVTLINSGVGQSQIPVLSQLIEVQMMYCCSL